MIVEYTITGTYKIDDSNSCLEDGAMRDSAEALVDECLSEALGDLELLFEQHGPGFHREHSSFKGSFVWWCSPSKSNFQGNLGG